jgi:hypothetical protein
LAANRSAIFRIEQTVLVSPNFQGRGGGRFDPAQTAPE